MTLTLTKAPIKKPLNLNTAICLNRPTLGVTATQNVTSQQFGAVWGSAQRSPIRTAISTCEPAGISTPAAGRGAPISSTLAVALPIAASDWEVCFMRQNSNPGRGGTVQACSSLCSLLVALFFRRNTTTVWPLTIAPTSGGSQNLELTTMPALGSHNCHGLLDKTRKLTLELYLLRRDAQLHDCTGHEGAADCKRIKTT